jgi:TonB family protein
MDTKDNSSLPLLLAITGSILVVAVGGWFFLGQQDSAAPTSESPAATQPSFSPEAAGEITRPVATVSETATPEVSTAVEVFDAPAAGVDAELRKARLAAEADILVVPAGQSALYYYGRILDIEPDHEIANAEMDAMLARAAQAVTEHIAAEQYEQAYEIAILVARRRPDHALVIETQQALDDYTEQQVQQAIQLVRDGKDEEAQQALTNAQGLPGRNPDYFAAVRESIAEIQDAREVAAEQDRRKRAADDARLAWIRSIRGAIIRGDLITPAGNSARDLLAQNNSWATERNQLNDEFRTALVTTAGTHIDANMLNEAAELIDAAAESGVAADDVSQLRASLEAAIIRKKSSTVVPLSELVQVKTASPSYPRQATRRNVSGYVDLMFTVTTNGTTADISVRRAEPETVFDEAAVKAVEAWEFEPVEYRGQVISQRTAARLVFRLE